MSEPIWRSAAGLPVTLGDSAGALGAGVGCRSLHWRRQALRIHELASCDRPAPVDLFRGADCTVASFIARDELIEGFLAYRDTVSSPQPVIHGCHSRRDEQHGGLHGRYPVL